MNNIMLSDFYRVKKGKILRLVCIGIIVIILIFAVITIFSQSALQTDLVIVPDGMSEAETEELKQDMVDLRQQKSSINSGAAFGAEILEQYFAAFFFLPIVIAVSGADFSAKTYRNILSFEYNRAKVYMAKLLLSAVICFFLLLGTLVAGWIIGSLAFGFSGFTLKYLGHIFLVIMMQCLVSFAIISTCQMLLFVTKRVLATVIVFCASQIAVMAVFRELASGKSSLKWLLLIEPYSIGALIPANGIISTQNILFMVCYYIGVAALTTVLGISLFRKSDMP